MRDYRHNGDYFGERALVRRERRAATVRADAASGCACLQLGWQAFETLVPPPSHKYGYRNPGLTEIYLHI
eukprot:COSAG01_NODE_246_length_20450_cov_195.166822_14_plen_70_part_00